MNKKLILAFGILLVFCFVSVNCSAQSSNNALVGKWVSEENQDLMLEFFKDGSGTNSFEDEIFSKFTWKTTESGLLTFSGDDELDGTWDFKITGSTLTIDVDGEVITLKRK
jgi:hypothetical protein